MFQESKNEQVFVGRTKDGIWDDMGSNLKICLSQHRQVSPNSEVWTCENGRRTVLHSVAYDVCQVQPGNQSSKFPVETRPMSSRCFFPTCQVRVVRFYVSLFSSFSSSSSFRRPPPPVVLLNCDPVSSVGHAGPQPRSDEFSVACWTPTAIL